jgi:hypothetical protein
VPLTVGEMSCTLHLDARTVTGCSRRAVGDTEQCAGPRAIGAPRASGPYLVAGTMRSSRSSSAAGLPRPSWLLVGS